MRFRGSSANEQLSLNPPKLEMRFRRSYSSYMNLSKLTGHILPIQSHLRANHRYPSSISASSRVLADTRIKNRGFGANPTSELAPQSNFRENQKYPTSVSASLGNTRDAHFRISQNQSYMNNGLMNSRYGSVGVSSSVKGVSGFRAYSSFFGGKGDDSVVKGLNVNNSDGIGSDGADTLKKAWQLTVDAAGVTGEKAKDAFEALTPHVQQLLDAHPYLNNVIIPVGWTLTGTLLAWLVMPRVLRKLHKYSMQGPIALLYRNSPQEQIPYQKSVWSSLEDPVRYLVTFMAFSQLAVTIAPTTIASQYIAKSWRGAAILSFIWFIHRWKTNVFSRALSTQNLLDRERMLALDKFSSMGLFVLGVMALAEECGVAVQSILTVGGIGGVATAFAGRDILMNVLSGLYMQFSKPFSLGDFIKAGSVEGRVVEIGLTNTSLITTEKFPVLVPNSSFLSQAIVNKSRAQLHAVVNKIHLRIDKLEKSTQIIDDIKSMLKSNSKIFLGEEVPYCFIRSYGSYAELTVGCNFKDMSKDELYAAELDILLQAVRIIKEHGALLTQDLAYQ